MADERQAGLARSYLFPFHQMGGAVGRAGSSSAFSGRDAGYTYNLVSTWPDPADDLMHITANRAQAADLAKTCDQRRDGRRGECWSCAVGA